MLADTLEGGVVATLKVLGRPAPDLTPTAGTVRGRRPPAPGPAADRWSAASSPAAPCATSRWCVLEPRRSGEVRSNTPINPAWGLPAPPGSHQCLDLGEEEYTRGRPHPMIDAEARLEVLRRARVGRAGGRDHRSTSSSATARTPTRPAVLAPACEALMARRRPAGRRLRPGHRAGPAGAGGAAGAARAARAASFTETAARASLVAAAIATGRADLVGQRP